jgi:hypothetical protein
MDTGIDYPTLTFGGATYTLRFTRGAFLYRMSKKGIELSDLNVRVKSASVVVDILLIALEGQYAGTPEQLSETLLDENKWREARAAVDAALGKVFPTPTQPAAAAAGEGKPQLQ